MGCSELKLDNLGDFLSNKNYEVFCVGMDALFWTPSFKEKMIIIENIHDGTIDYSRYRYQLKPLEPIRVTDEVLNKLINSHPHYRYDEKNNSHNWISTNGEEREVIIID